MLQEAVVIARAAGREIYRIWKEGFAVSTKLDGSIVTIADQNAEAIILAGLSRLAGDIPVIAEEEVAAGRVPDFAERFFLVDPLDGTKGFSEGKKDEFTVNIGLIEHDRPTMGVVYAPATGQLWAGGADGAWEMLCDPGSAEPIGERRAIRVSERAGGWRIVSSHTFRNQQLQDFADAIGARETIGASSSLKFARVANGEADIYPRFGPLSEWDVAAGHGVLVAAGGDIMTLDGAPLRYGRRDRKFALDGLVAYGGPASQAAARAGLRAV
jgi:3'(2'), 5'-bisphosphate nucleotidase